MKLTNDVLRSRGMPQPDHQADKEGRGTVLVVAGSAEVPGAALLAAIAALRVGAGRLTIATAARVAVPLGLQVPEARVIGLTETAHGGIDPAGAQRLLALGRHVDAMVIGPGMADEEATVALTQALLAGLAVPTVLDALAMSAAVAERPRRRDVVLTPHAGEMAHLTGLAKEAVLADAPGQACDAADRWGVGVVLKGATTCIAWPGEACWHHDGGDVGLATSGSGDTLAGLLGGLMARGLPPLDAALWAVRLHALAGERLAARHGRLGYLARELGAEVPAAMHALCAPSRPA